MMDELITHSHTHNKKWDFNFKALFINFLTT